MAFRAIRRAALVATAALVSACGAILGIDTDLDVKASDASVPIPDVEAAAPIDAGTDAFDVVDTGAPPPKRPPEGTYVYEATGFDQINTSFGGNVRQNYGPTASVDVTYIGTDCFEMKFTFRSTYVETIRMCIVGLDYVQDKGTRFQQFGVLGSASTTLKCEPGDIMFTTAPTPIERAHDCTGDNSETKSNGNSKFRVAGPYRFIADQNIDVKGALVATRHFKGDKGVSGAQNGSNVADWYFGPDDGVLVRFNRKVDIDFGSPIGPVKYVEDANLLLVKRPGASDASTD